MKNITITCLILMLVVAGCGKRSDKESKRGSRVLADYVETPLNKANDMSNAVNERNNELSEHLVEDR